MVNEILYHLSLGKHYWRSVPFAEMAELYASRLLRNVSQGMIGLFVVVFLYQRGYGVASIFALVGGYYLLRAFFSVISAYYIAWAGPKRAILVSNILIVPSLWALVMIDSYTLLAVLVYFGFQAASLALYYVAADVQFSSIKHAKVEGREVGWLHIMEKIGTGVAPLVGGVVAYMFGPELVMWIASALSIASAFPLFLSPEKIRRKQKIIFRGFPRHVLQKQLVSVGFMGVDYVTTTATWALFIAVVVFGTTDNSVYAKLGVAFSVSLVASIATSRLYGVLIDKRRSSELYHTGVVVNALIHGIRPFITNVAGVVATNAANEIGTSAYTMPYVQNMYDTADNLPGYRIVYLSLMMSTLCIGAAFMAFLTALLVWKFGATAGMQYSFILAAVMTLFLSRHGFAALRRSS